jgi:hypothetical protein
MRNVPCGVDQISNAIIGQSCQMKTSRKEKIDGRQESYGCGSNQG